MQDGRRPGPVGLRCPPVLFVLTALVCAVGTAPSGYADPGPAPDPPGAVVPTVDEIVADLNGIFDPNRPWDTKTDVVSPGWPADDGPRMDDNLQWMERHRYLPLNFVVTDIVPAPNDYAGVTVSVPHRPYSSPRPIVLVKQGDQWKITADTAFGLYRHIFNNATWVPAGFY